VTAAEILLALPARIALLVLGGAVLLLNAVGLPGNWILLSLALLYAFLTDFQQLGWIAVALMGALAIAGELLELGVGAVYTAKRGATRRAVLGSFLGGIAGALLAAPLVPPFGSMLGAFAGSFMGAVAFEYWSEQHLPQALRAGRAAFVGRVLAALVKSVCGFWMWLILAYRLLWPG
jgi:uncharacterized protein YqgC (DUF456 family)